MDLTYYRFRRPDRCGTDRSSSQVTEILMFQTFATLLVIGLMVLLVLAVIYEPAWMEILRSRQARRRREEQSREGN